MGWTSRDKPLQRQANPAESPKEKMHTIWSDWRPSLVCRGVWDAQGGFCNCDMHDEIPFNDFRPEAKWKSTCFSAAEMAEKYSHELFAVPGLHPLKLYLDILHTLDLGVSCHVCGNILWEILEDHLEEPSREGRLASLNKMIVEEYNALGTPASQRVGLLKISNIGGSSSVYPLLKHIKGRRGDTWPQW